MIQSPRHITRSLDWAGGLTTLALVGIGGWVGLVRPSPAAAERSRLRSEMQLRHADMAKLERESAEFHAALRERQAELDAAGAPPARSPIEEDLRTVNELLRRHGLHAAEVSPLGSTEYAGVLESRYRIRASGRWQDMVSAFQDFERCRFWGDVTQLKMDDAAAASADAQGQTQAAELTLSFYSATVAPDPAAKGGNS